MMNLIAIKLNSACIDHYVYPVAYFIDSEGDHLLVIHQQEIDLLELYDVKPGYSQAEKILSTMYLPAAVRILPGYQGFSFVDNGRIKIKQFLKRSAKSLDFFEPIYGIEQIEWIDDQTGYFHARDDNRLAIYQFNVEGDLDCICSSGEYDCQYPQIISEIVWFIGRTFGGENQRYFIGQADYRGRKPAENICQIIDFGQIPIMLLQMASDTCGYVVSMPQPYDPESSIIKFGYYLLQKKGRILGQKSFV